MTNLQNKLEEIKNMKVKELVAESKKIKDSTGINHIAGYTSMKKLDLINALTEYYNNPPLELNMYHIHANISNAYPYSMFEEKECTEKTNKELPFNENNVASHFKNMLKNCDHLESDKIYNDTKLAIEIHINEMKKVKKNNIVSKWNKQLNIVKFIMKSFTQKNELIYNA